MSNVVNIQATTASTPDQSSYAALYNDTLQVRSLCCGVLLRAASHQSNLLLVQTYLGDEYSTQWMNDTDAANMRTESLADQFTVMKKIYNSQPQNYGTDSPDCSAVLLIYGPEPGLC